MTRGNPVLVVEDDASLARLYAEELRDEGYEVETVRTGAAALEAVERVTPAAVVLDIRLPGMDGIEVLRALKGRRPALPVVLNTAYEDYTHDLGSWGCDEYVVKSADTSRLLAAIRRVLTGSSIGSVASTCPTSASAPIGRRS